MSLKTIETLGSHSQSASAATSSALLLALGALLWTFCCLGAPAGAAEDPPTPPQSQEEARAEEEQQQGRFADVIVVTASRTKQYVNEVPATISVLSQEKIEELPSDDFGDLLRNLPGLNVAQMGTRSIQVTGRHATQALANSQLVLLDGRTLYLDYLGFVVWEFVPAAQQEIEQIEVVRGPGSAVWGANAMTGVINILTKPPSSLAGTTSVRFGAGELSTLLADVLHAGQRDNWAYKISAGYYEQDAYERPTGLVPGTGTPYPPYDNRDVREPRFNLQLDYQQTYDTTWSLSTGAAETTGNLHTPVGPWAWEQGSGVTYVKADWNRRAMRVGFYANLFEAVSSSQVTIDTTGNPVRGDFVNDVHHIEFGNTSVIGQKHILTYGISARNNDFDIDIAPGGQSRREYALYIQDDLLATKKIRWVIGARWDEIDPVAAAISPRTSLMISATPRHTLRFSYNRAFRVANHMENFIRVDVGTLLPLPTGPYIVPTQLIGEPGLEEEKLTAVEISYDGFVLNDKASVSLAVYRSKLRDAIDFFPATFYTPANPPPGWPLPPELLGVPPLNGLLETFIPRNVGEIVNKGFEASMNLEISPRWSAFANYSYQAEPDVEGITLADTNIPPEHRFNVGGSYRGDRLLAGLNANFVDEAFWTDVLDARFHGPTDSYIMVNGKVGWRFGEDRLAVSLSAQNLFDERIQQHVFGDIISRKVSAEIRLDF